MKLFVWLLMALPGMCFAGPISSGGGNAVACYSSSGDLVSARLLDFYEGRSIFGDADHLQPTTGYKDLIKTVLKRLQTTGYSLYIPNINNMQTSVDIVERNRRFLPEWDRLKTVDDSFENLTVPKGCKIEQAALFIDEKNIVFDRRIWNVFSDTDRAGLIMHEAIYWYTRENGGAFDSRRSRRTVSLSFAEEWNFKDVKMDLPKSYILCRSIDYQHSRYNKPTVFAIYPQSGLKVIQFFALEGDFTLSLKRSYFAGKFPFMSNGSDPGSYSMNLFTDSDYEDADRLRFDRNPSYDSAGKIMGDVITISGVKPSYPQNTIQKVQVLCSLIK